MKQAALFILIGSVGLARADLTLVEKVDTGGAPSEMTVKIKGDKVRIDPAREMSMITDSKTGDTLTLMHSEKKVIRISRDKMKAAAEMVSKFAGNSPAPETSKLTPTGRKETVNGIETEIYTAETALGKATYYIATHYPDAAAILAEMKHAQPAPLSNVATSVPDFRDLPGVPVKIEMDAQGRHVVITLVAIKRDPIADGEFDVPNDYSEMKMPDILGGKIGGGAIGTATPKVSNMPATMPSPAPTPP